MLEKLYKKGYLDYKQMIVDFSKPLGLNAEEVMILLCILRSYSLTNTISVEAIQSQILMSSSQLDKLIANLMERGFYEVYLSYDNGKGVECISFNPLFEKIEKLLNQKEMIDSYDIEKTNQYITSKMNRILTASELEILQSLMIDDHYSYNKIAETVDKILASKRTLSMRTIALELSNKEHEVKVVQEAPSAFKDFLKRI